MRNISIFWKRLGLLLVTLLCAVPLAAVLFLPTLEITGTDMFPTLMDGDIVMVWPGTDWSRGDVIAFSCQERLLVKRVAGVGGDTVTVDEDGTVEINGRVWELDGVLQNSLGLCDSEQPWLVPEGSVFVLGDERLGAVDSRNSSVGCIPEENILGRVVLRVWPLTAFGGI